jgi:hypothetical protein
MKKKRFKHDFLRGLGSALIEIQSNKNPKSLSEAVSYGCLHNTTYDMQYEGDRGWYLYRAAQLIGDGEAIEASAIEKFRYVKEDYGLFVQLGSILYRFAADGSEKSRAALYRQYEDMIDELSLKNKKTTNKRYSMHTRSYMFDSLCIRLTYLDGWSAFKRIVRDISEILLPKDTDCFFSEWFYDCSQLHFGKKRVDDYLRKQAGRSAYAHIYYEKAREWDAHVFSDRPVPTFEEILAKVEGKEFHGRGIVMSFARNANPGEIEKLARAAMNETNEQIQIELLWPFRRIVRFSFPDEFLMRIRESNNNSLRGIAYDILGCNPSPKTRELALSLIRSGKDIENGFSLLSKNLRPTDEALFCAAIKSLPIRHDEETWHGIFMAAEDGLKVMRGKPKTDILEYIYRNTLCGSCRERIIRLMHKKKTLSETILRECQFDSNREIRTFAERIIKYRKDSFIKN